MIHSQIMSPLPPEGPGGAGLGLGLVPSAFGLGRDAETDQNQKRQEELAKQGRASHHPDLPRILPPLPPTPSL